MSLNLIAGDWSEATISGFYYKSAKSCTSKPHAYGVSSSCCVYGCKKYKRNIWW